MAGTNVFLSYRREDAEGYAGRLHDRLSARFPGRVFRDVKDLEPGVDFVDEIERKLESCQVMIAVIGPRWLTLTDGTSTRRIDRPNDLHRLELVTALRRKVRVIPILVGGASMPSAEELPQALAFLARRQALAVTEPDFDHDVGRLIGVLEKELGEQGQAEPILATQVAGREPRAMAAAEPGRPAPSSSPVPPAKAGRLRWMVVGGVLAVVVLGVVGSLLAEGGSPNRAPVPVAGSSAATPPPPAVASTEAPSPPPPSRRSAAPATRAVAAEAVDVPAADASGKLEIAWKDGTGDLLALVPTLSPADQAQLSAAVTMSAVQGGDIFAVHVRTRNAGRSSVLVTPQQFSLHLGPLSTPLASGVHPGFFRGGTLRPGQVMEGLLMFPANNYTGGTIRAGGGELRFHDDSVEASIVRK